MKNLLQNKEFQLDEILFQGRNKAYGAYTLRQESDRILTKSMIVGIALFTVLSAVPLFLNSYKTSDPVLGTGDYSKHVLKRVEYRTPEKNPPATVVPQVPSKIKTVVSQVPTPSSTATQDQPPAKISDTGVRSLENIKGTETTTYITPSVTNHPVSLLPAVTPPANIPNNDPMTKVDVEATFSGGINAFRNKVVSQFNTSGFEGIGEKLSTVVTFIVEKDGTISAVKANGKNAEFSREAEKTIRSVKGKWTPAKIKGQPVRSYFSFPITMMFE